MAARGPPRRPERELVEVYQVERRAVVLDYIEGGYYLDPHKWHRSRSVVQAIGTSRFTLLDGIPLHPVEPLEEVSVLREQLENVEEPLDPTGRRTRRIPISLACMSEGSSNTCMPIDKVEQRLLDLLRATSPVEINIVNSPDELSKLLASKGLPAKAIAVPRTPLRYDDLSEIAKRNLRDAVKNIIKSNERAFVEFFNKAEPINIRLHSMELLRGVGKKTLKVILDTRSRKPFESFEEIRKIIKDDPVDVLTDKIMEELSGQSKYNLFVQPQHPGVPFLDYLSIIMPRYAGKEGRQ